MINVIKLVSSIWMNKLVLLHGILFSEVTVELFVIDVQFLSFFYVLIGKYEYYVWRYVPHYDVHLPAVVYHWNEAEKLSVYWSLVSFRAPIWFVFETV